MNSRISRRSALLLLAAALTPTAGVKASELPSGFHPQGSSADTFNWLLPELASFFGTSTGNFINRDELIDLGYDPQTGKNGQLYLSDQFAPFFYSSPEFRIIMPNGDRILEASWPHFAVRRAFVITQADSTRILSVALLAYATPTSNVEDERSLLIFSRSKNPASPSMVDQLKHWVKLGLRQESADFSNSRLRATESQLKVFEIPI